jgi:hypothetical protein
MATIDLSQFHDDTGFSVIPGGPHGVIDRNSLVEILSSLNRTLRAIGAVADPAYQVHVSIAAVRPGNCRTSCGPECSRTWGASWPPSSVERMPRPSPAKSD